MKKNYNITAYKADEIVKKYIDATNNVGLWNSEKYAIKKYFNQESKILDVACGTGRTTYGMHKLGYKNIIGIDFSSEMITAARNINTNINNIEFVCCDMKNIPFNDCSFNSAFVSYNALMMVPTYENRIMVLNEIGRVLSKNGVLIFTASDREKNLKFKKFWLDEKKRWNKGENDKRLYEYGDQIFTECGKEVFIHFSTFPEIKKMLKETGYELLECFFRNQFCEPECVKEFSGDTMFYIVKKN